MQDVTWSFWAELDTIRKLLQTNPIEAQRSLDRLYSRESRRRSRQTPHRLMVASDFAALTGWCHNVDATPADRGFMNIFLGSAPPLAG